MKGNKMIGIGIILCLLTLAIPSTVALGNDAPEFVIEVVNHKRVNITYLGNDLAPVATNVTWVILYKCGRSIFFVKNTEIMGHIDKINDGETVTVRFADKSFIFGLGRISLGVVVVSDQIPVGIMEWEYVGFLLGPFFFERQLDPV